MDHGPAGRTRAPPPPHLPDLSGTPVTGRPARQAGRSLPRTVVEGRRGPLRAPAGGVLAGTGEARARSSG